MERFLCRAWHKAEKRMFDVEGVFPYQDEHTKGGEVFEKGKDVSYYFPEEVELMQCTGLKDKNGKLIYEGDIVKIEYYDFEIKHRIGIVEWEDDGFCITYHNAKDTKVSGCSLVDIVNGDKQEVIGNIYENSELLKDGE